MKTRVMIVEDERIVALNLKQRLTKLGYEIIGPATSGQEALRHVADSKPDVVLMDINIDGDMDGIETASRIPPDSFIPVIYLTAYSEEATLERARSTKPYGFLLKPFSERELHATIQMVLERRRADQIVRLNEQRLNALVEERTAELQNEVVERQKTEVMLRHAQKMEAIGQLTGGIAHDFNNMLQAILSSLALARRGIERSRVDEAEAYIARAAASAVRAASVTHSLLAFARRQPLAPEPVNVPELSANVADLIRRTLGETVDVKLAHGDDVWWTRCDPDQLQSAVLNLAINSRDAMPDGGTLTIESTNTHLDATAAAALRVVAGDFVCVSVSDSGTGMTSDVSARAFEPFFTTKPTGQGTGLGLSMVFGFVQQSDGGAKIFSEPGRGTTVKLFLPRYMGPGREPGDAPAVRTSPNAVSGETILVIEDESTVRSNIVEKLRELGYSVLESEDGPAGLEIMRSPIRLDILVTDVGLPGLNGRQVADAGRELRPDLRVLFMTGYAENATASQGFLRPGMQIITKPFSLDLLGERVRAMLG